MSLINFDDLIEVDWNTRDSDCDSNQSGLSTENFSSECSTASRSYSESHADNRHGVNEARCSSPSDILQCDSTSDASDTEYEPVSDCDVNYESKSDTEFEGEVTLEWHNEDYSKYVHSKYLAEYLRTKCSATIITIIDRRQPNWRSDPTIKYLPIIYKHNDSAKQTLHRFYVHSDKKIGTGFFSSIPYPVLRTNVIWPGVVPPTVDHAPSSPFFCVRDWRSNTKPVYKE